MNATVDYITFWEVGRKILLDFLNPVVIMDGGQTMTIKIDGTRIRAALRGFLELLESTDKHANVELLELWLGQLAFIQHFIGDVQEDGKSSPPPVRDYTHWRKLIAEQFPVLGYYSIPDAIPLQTSASGISVGDAVDNLVEITAEIAECVWRWENNGENDALWYLRFSYQTHWGTQLRHLQAYIHNLPVRDRNKPARR
jgi:hypothetical protein